MTPAEQRLLDRILRRAGDLTPDLKRSLERAFDRLRVSFSESQVADMIAAGRIDSVITSAFSDEIFQTTFAPFRETLRGGVADSARSFLRDIPARGPSLTFDTLSPRVIEGIRTLETRVMSSIRDELVREPVRAYVENGLIEGVNPRTTARHLRTVVGLSENQTEAVRNFRRMLESGDRQALTRKLRDKRFDGTLRKRLGANGEGLSKEQIDRMSDAYRKRMIGFNAEVHARSAALDAQRLAQRLSWENAIASGLVERSQLRKRWVSSGDARVRPAHVALNGQTVGFDEPFGNGDVTPGESDYNCRCIAAYYIARAAA